MIYKFFCLFLFVFLSSFLFFQIPSKNRLELDSQLYDRIAKNFADNGTLKDSNNPEIMPVTALGYPLFMGMIFKAFGENYKIIVLLQIILSLFCFLLIYNISLALLGEKTANISLFISCINLGFIVHAQFILTEILLVTFLLLFLYFFIKFLDLKNTYSLLYSGIFLGISILIKPVAIFFWPVPIFLIFNKFDLFLGFKNSFFFLLFFLVPIFGYTFFNYKNYNKTSINPAGYENIYRYYLPRLLACKDNSSLDLAQIKVDSLVNDDNDINSRYSLELQKLFLETILSNPILAILVWFKNVIKTYCGLYTTELKVLLNSDLRGGACSYFNMTGNFLDKVVNYVTFGTSSNIVKFIGFWEIMYLMFQYLLIFFSFYNLFKLQKFNILFLLLSFIIYFALITGHDGFGRYRMVFEPVLIILNSIGITQFYELFFKRRYYA